MGRDVMVNVKVEKANIRFKNLDPEYVNNRPKIAVSDFRKERTKVVTVRVPFEVYRRMELYSKNHGVTVSEFVRRAIEQYLNGGGQNGNTVEETHDTSSV